MAIITEGMKVEQSLNQIQGNFQGASFGSHFPLPRVREFKIVRQLYGVHFLYRFAMGISRGIVGIYMGRGRWDFFSSSFSSPNSGAFQAPLMPL